MDKDEAFMRRAIALAVSAKERGDEPFGAVLVRDGELVMEGENRIFSASDPTWHAEIGLIRRFCAATGVTDLSEYTLYSSCEPCAMCSSSMVWAKLGRLVYSVTHEQFAQIAGSNIAIPCTEVFARSPHKPQVTERLLNEEGLRAFEGFFG